MKFFSLAFIIAVYLIISPESKASELHNYAYCSGYAGKMSQVYKMKYYYDMQQYFDSKIQEPDVDAITSEYYQSGSEIVRTDVAISNNLINKCEDAYKRRLP